MIVPMKKIYLVVQNKDKGQALDTLRELGSVHIENLSQIEEHANTDIKEELQRLDQVLSCIDPFQKKEEQRHVMDPDEKIERLLSFIKGRNALQERVEKREGKIKKWESWGNFNPRDIQDLLDNGVYVNLYEIPKQSLEEISDKFIVRVIVEMSDTVKCMVISREEINLSFIPLQISDVSLKEMKEEQKKDFASLKVIEADIKKDSIYFDSLQRIKLERQEELELQEVALGMEKEESLVYLKGFSPVDTCDSLMKKAKEHRWGLVVETPKEEDQPPTLIKNPKWINIVNPLFKLMNIVPGYQEVDTSFFFLFFFSIFFGVLIGDAAYGLFFAAVTLYFHRKLDAKVKNKGAFYLLYVLSASAIVWGVLTGTFFGQAWAKGIIPPVMPWLNDSVNLQMLCFLVGAIHLSIAHLWRVIIKFPSLSFLADIGWLIIVWCMYFVAKMLILGTATPSTLLLYGMVGAVLVVLFTKPNRNPLKAIGPGLGDFLLNIVNCFTDVVSYIRLFAVGLASVAVADAFNEMALGIGFGSVGAGLITAAILILGHLFNIVLGGMAVLVHGLRLNVLEFSGHLSMQWTGFKYNPFCKKVKKV